MVSILVGSVLHSVINTSASPRPEAEAAVADGRGTIAHLARRWPQSAPDMMLTSIEACAINIQSLVGTLS